MNKVLIVDDEVDIGMMISKILQKQNLDVAYVDRINKAKDLIENHSFDIFFLDLNLPDGTGFDLIPIIRSVNEQAKLIIISAYDGILENNKIVELEVDLFIKKPFTKQNIVNAVHTLAN